MGYHKNEIQKGELGKFSKIKEEFQELEDALEQGNRIMAILECADLLGAMESYLLKNYNLTLGDLLRMSNATRSAFEDGTRK